MNAKRRKSIEASCKLFNLLKEKFNGLKDEIEDIKQEFEIIQDEEQEYLDNMPESFHGGENYSKSESCIEEMDKIIEGLETIASEIDDIPSSDDLLNVI